MFVKFIVYGHSRYPYALKAVGLERLLNDMLDSMEFPQNPPFIFVAQELQQDQGSVAAHRDIIPLIGNQ